MNWKYYIPHAWPKERERWEDFYLLPCDPNYSGESIWLTIDALGDGSEPLLDAREEFEERLKCLGDQEYVINGTDMIVRGIALTKEEFLKWVKVWLEENGFDVDELVEAPFEDFEGTNQHARIVVQCRVQEAELLALDPSEREKRLIPFDSVNLWKSRDQEQEEE